MEWESGTQPWIRSQPPRTKVTCYFCGEATAIVSRGDIGWDHGRVQLYCTSDACDARTVEILVTKDGGQASTRSDVQALAAIDDPPELVLRQARGELAFTADDLGNIYGDDDPVPRRLGLDRK